MSAFAELLTGNRVIRTAADAFLARFARRRTLYLDHVHVPTMQEAVLRKLVHYARHTRFAKEHDFANIRTISDYQQRVPIRTYEAFWKDYWQPVFPKLEGATWPSHIPYYALSSGTTSGTTKYIPVSKQMLSSNRKAGFTTIAFHRHVYPKTSLFNGRVFFLGGNTALNKLADGSFAGDLSGIAAREVMGLLRPYTYPPLELSRIADWDTKADTLARASANLPITVMSGVPSWMLMMFDRLKKVTGKSTIAEIWPTFRILIHGGTKFDPYREVFRREIGSDLVKFLEVYPCSEGFVATEDPRYDLMRVIPDHGIFFEFVPVEELDGDRIKVANPTRHTLANVEIGTQYAIVMTTCAGLWSYLVGDTIAFERRDPPLIRFTGRTKYFLSAFGEHLISEEIERAVSEAAQATSAEYIDFHVGPVFPSDPKKPGHHLFLIEFRKPPTDMAEFVRILDATLSRLNEDYAAHRAGDLTMELPHVQSVASGGFTRWMLSRGKDAQSKVPRMDNNGTITNTLQAWLKEHRYVG